MAHGTYYPSFFVNRPDELSARIGQETLVISGTARGMTSFVAYVCHESGYFLGEQLGSQNYEDKDLKQILPPLMTLGRRLKQGSLKARLKQLIKFRLFGRRWILKRRGLMAFIQFRNAEFTRWGFKLPYCGDYVDVLSTELRNPVFVVCVRNPIATCRSIAKREPGRKGTLGNLHKILEPMRTIEALQRLDQPFIAIDMDAAKRDPAQFLKDFGQIMGLDIPKQRLKRALSKPGYKRSEPQDGVIYSAA